MQKKLLGTIYVDFYATNRSITDNIFCIRQIFARTREHNSAVHQLFLNFKAAYDPVGRGILYNIPLSLVSPWN